jgi:uncharacterized protein YraI
MSTTPPEHTPPHTPPPARGYGMPTIPSGARLPVPGNAEFLMWLVVTIVLMIIWAAADSVNTLTFVGLWTALTIGYLISRGIAKASRVLEH